VSAAPETWRATSVQGGISPHPHAPVAVIQAVAYEQLHRLHGSSSPTRGDRCTNARRAATRRLIPLVASRAVAQLG
jgi:hypothetical protein